MKRLLAILALGLGVAMFASPASAETEQVVCKEIRIDGSWIRVETTFPGNVGDTGFVNASIYGYGNQLVKYQYVDCTPPSTTEPPPPSTEPPPDTTEPPPDTTEPPPPPETTEPPEPPVTEPPVTEPPITEPPVTEPPPPPTDPEIPTTPPPALPDDCINGSTRWTFQKCGEVQVTTTVQPATGEELPATGFGTGPMLGAVMVFLVVGFGAVRLARRS